MQGPTPKSNSSLFDSIFNAIAPAEAVKSVSLKKQKKVVFDIFYEVRTDYIHVSLECYGPDEDYTSDVFIMHADMHAWLKDTDRLSFTTGSNHMEGGVLIEEDDSYEMGYVEYIEGQMTTQDIKEFIKYKHLPYEFDGSI